MNMTLHWQKKRISLLLLNSTVSPILPYTPTLRMPGSVPSPAQSFSKPNSLASPSVDKFDLLLRPEHPPSLPSFFSKLERRHLSPPSFIKPKYRHSISPYSSKLKCRPLSPPSFNKPKHSPSLPSFFSKLENRRLSPPSFSKLEHRRLSPPSFTKSERASSHSSRCSSASASPSEQNFPMLSQSFSPTVLH